MLQIESVGFKTTIAVSQDQVHEEYAEIPLDEWGEWTGYLSFLTFRGEGIEEILACEWETGITDITIMVVDDEKSDTVGTLQSNPSLIEWETPLVQFSIWSED